MPNEKNTRALQKRLKTHRRVLSELLEQRATMGIYAPPMVAIQIDQARDDIRRVKDALRGLGVTVEDHPDDFDEDEQEEDEEDDGGSKESSHSAGRDSDSGDEPSPAATSAAAPASQSIATLDIYLSDRVDSTNGEQDTSTYDIRVEYEIPSHLTRPNPYHGSATIDWQTLRSLEIRPQDYGKQIRDMLLNEEGAREKVRDAIRDSLQAGNALRMQLSAAKECSEVHTIAWEMLAHPLEDTSYTPLLANERLLFSRFIHSDEQRDMSWDNTFPCDALRALVVISNPTGVGEYEDLHPIDVQKEKDIVQKALGTGAKLTVVGEDTPATLNNIISYLRDEYHLLYIVAHGKITEEIARLWLQNEEGESAPTSVEKFIARMTSLERFPNLIVLSSCEGAGQGYTNNTDARQAPHDAHIAFGPRLAAKGVPAVLAMNGSISMETANQFFQTFFQELRRDGTVDRAAAAARSAVRERRDWWMFTLFLSLKNGRVCSGAERRIEVNHKSTPPTPEPTPGQGESMSRSLPPDFSDRLFEILKNIPAMGNIENRNILLNGIPLGPRGALNRSNAITADLYNIVDSARGWGKVEPSGEWALVIIAKNALKHYAEGVEQGEELKALLASAGVV